MTPSRFRALSLTVGTCCVLALPLSRFEGQTIGSAARSEAVRPSDDLLRVGMRYQYDNVSDVDPWQDATLEYAQRLSLGTIVLGLNGARHYGSNGSQLELQAYPHFNGHSYLFFDVAASSTDKVFIPLRVSLEPYYNFDNGWEMSAGAQYLDAPGPDVYTYSGTLAKYVGNYWISARPHYTPIASNNSYGLGVTARRYFSGRYDYATLTVSRSVGVDPESVDPSVFSRLPKLGTYTIAVDRRQPLGRTHARATYGAGYRREEIAPGRNRLHRTATVGLEWFIP